MAKIALTVMRVYAQLRNGTIMIVTEPYGLMMKDIASMRGTAGTAADMPGSHSVILTRGKEPDHVYTAHTLTDLIGAVNDMIDLTITERTEREGPNG